MEFTSVTNLSWANSEQTVLNATVNFAGLGEVPFSTSADELTPHGQRIWNDAVAGDFGPIAEYEAPDPEPEPVPQSVTMRQARLALLSIGMLQAVDMAIDALPEPQRTAARIEWEYSQEVERNKEFVLLLAPALGLTDEQLDDLFRVAVTL